MFDTKVVSQLGCVEQLVALLFQFKELALCNLLFHDLKTIGFVPRGMHHSQIASFLLLR